MKKGKMYIGRWGIIVICTKNTDEMELSFEGVIIKHSKNTSIGTYSKFLKCSEFTEVVGQVDLNNVFIQ